MLILYLTEIKATITFIISISSFIIQFSGNFVIHELNNTLMISCLGIINEKFLYVGRLRNNREDENRNINDFVKISFMFSITCCNRIKMITSLYSTLSHLIYLLRLKLSYMIRKAVLCSIIPENSSILSCPLMLIKISDNRFKIITNVLHLQICFNCILKYTFSFAKYSIIFITILNRKEPNINYS